MKAEIAAGKRRDCELLHKIYLTIRAIEAERTAKIDAAEQELYGDLRVVNDDAVILGRQGRLQILIH